MNGRAEVSFASARGARNPTSGTGSGALSSFRSEPPALPPNPAPEEARVGRSWLAKTEVATGTPRAAPVPSSPIAAPASGGLPADDDGSLVKDRDSGHLASGGHPALPGASHLDLAGIR